MAYEIIVRIKQRATSRACLFRVLRWLNQLPLQSITNRFRAEGSKPPKHPDGMNKLKTASAVGGLISIKNNCTVCLQANKFWHPKCTIADRLNRVSAEIALCKTGIRFCGKLRHGGFVGCYCCRSGGCGGKCRIDRFINVSKHRYGTGTN